jgi:hypothetical protein
MTLKPEQIAQWANDQIIRLQAVRDAALLLNGPRRGRPPKHVDLLAREVERRNGKRKSKHED